MSWPATAGHPGDAIYPVAELSANFPVKADAVSTGWPAFAGHDKSKQAQLIADAGWRRKRSTLSAKIPA
jgi:hypothetical protein